MTIKKPILVVSVFLFIFICAAFAVGFQEKKSAEYLSCLNLTEAFVKANWGGENQQLPTEYSSFYDKEKNRCLAEIRQDYHEFYDIYLFDVNTGEVLSDRHGSRDL